MSHPSFSEAVDLTITDLYGAMSVAPQQLTATNRIYMMKKTTKGAFTARFKASVPHCIERYLNRDHISVEGLIKLASNPACSWRRKNLGNYLGIAEASQRELAYDSSDDFDDSDSDDAALVPVLYNGMTGGIDGLGHRIGK